MRVDFVANVSHEIRTPLTSIKGYTQLLESQKSKVDPELHIFLEKIITNTERMISLFNDLLNLSVIESKNIMKFEEFDLKDLIYTIAGNIRTNYPNKKVNITKDIQLTTITGDERLMEQVISNLIDNACKYSGDTIAIKIHTFSKDNMGYIAVADDGPGIPKEHIQRIFERFYRVDSSRETSRGTGLGLSIVKHIITKHGGRIWAETEEPHGTKFIIELPLS
jgi:two-component system phosphate regulon sensor histidine kinase PhoR